MYGKQTQLQNVTGNRQTAYAVTDKLFEEATEERCEDVREKLMSDSVKAQDVMTTRSRGNDGRNPQGSVHKYIRQLSELEKCTFLSKDHRSLFQSSMLWYWNGCQLDLMCGDPTPPTRVLYWKGHAASMVRFRLPLGLSVKKKRGKAVQCDRSPTRRQHSQTVWR